MNQKNINLLASELAFYEIHDTGYDPLKRIIDFWKKYDLIGIRNTFNVLLKKLNDPNYTDEPYVHQHMQIFSVDLIRILIAYFIVHTRNIDMNGIDLSNADSTQVSLAELSITARIDEFFKKIAEQS